MSKFKSLIKEIKIYGVEFKLLYQKENNYTTSLDIILSLFSIIFVLIISIKYFSEFIQKQNFTIVTNYHPLTKNMPINFSSNPIFFGLYDWNGNIKRIDPSYCTLTLDLNQHILIKNESLERISTNVKIHYCNESEETKQIMNYGYDSEYYTCVKPNQNLTISGRYGDRLNGFDILEAHLNKCKNSSESNIKCKSEDEINEYLKNSFIHLFYLNYEVDHYNISNPFTQHFRVDSFPISLNVIKRYFIYYTYSIYLQFTGFIFEKMSKNFFYEFKDIQIDFVEDETNSYYKNDNIIVEIVFTIWDKETKYIRKFPFIQDVLGDIGGLTGIISTVFQFISNFFSEKLFLVDFSNNLINNRKIDKSYFFNTDIKKSLTVKNNLTQSSRSKFVYDIKNNLNLNDNKKYIVKKTMIKKKNEVFVKKNYVETLNKIEKPNNTEHTPNSSVSIFEKNKQTIKFPLLYYITPFFIFDNTKNNEIISCYNNIFKKFLSIEVMVPLLERISIMINMKQNDKYLFKIDSFLKNNINKNQINK